MNLKGYNYRGIQMARVAYKYGISRKSNHPVSDLLVKVGREKFCMIMRKEGIYDSRRSHKSHS